jgi:hypothetical protein
MATIIDYVWQFNKALADGAYAWPGGYPLYFVTADGGALSFESAQENAAQIRDAIIEDDKRGGWRVIGVEVNWEDGELYCDHSGERIESAYAEPNDERQHCDECGATLEPSQCGLCDECRDEVDK